MEGLKSSTINAGPHDKDRSPHSVSLPSQDFPARSIDEHRMVVLRAASISVLNQDRTLRYIWASNPLAGYSVDRILNRTDEELFAPGNALRLAELKCQALEGGIGVREEIEISANEETFVFDIFIEPLRNEDGAVVGITCAFRDITEQRGAQRDLQRAKAAADAAMRAKAEFLAIMSHEICTPLNAIVGMAGLLQNDELTADQQDCAETIRSSGEALLAIINNILDLSKIERGYLELERQPFDLTACIKDSLDLTAQKAIEKGLKLTCSLDEALPRIVTGDVNRIRQVLVNLLDNAIKFTNHGVILVSVKQFSIDTEIYELQFSVTDSSPLQSLEEIPVSRSRALRILIAEDNTVNQKVMLRMLSQLGYRADAVANGFEVLRALLWME